MSKPSKAALRRFEERFTSTFGDDTIELAEDATPYDILPTGSLALDEITTVGGLVEGRLYEYWGTDAIGKTTIALLTGREFQRKYPERYVGFIDMEQKLDNPWLRKLGLDPERFYHVHPKTAEDVADMLKQMMQSGFIGYIVLDSIGSMLPKVETEKDADEATVGLQAKVVTRMVKMAAVDAGQHNCTVVFINQVRANISQWGPDTDTPGGFALKHATTMKFRFKPSSTLQVRQDGELLEVGQQLKVKTERNNVGPKGATAELTLLTRPSKFGPVGLDKADEAFRIGTREDIIERSGAWYTTPDGEQHQGGDAVIDHLRENPDVVEAIREQFLNGKPEPEPEEEDAE